MKLSGPRVWWPLLMLVTAVALVMTALVFYSVPNTPEVISVLTTKYLIVSTALLTLMLLVVSLAYSDLRRRKTKIATRSEEKFSRVLQHLDTIFYDQTRVNAFLLKYQHESDKLEACAREASTFLKFLVDETRTIFDDLTSRQCAVSIKLLVPTDSGKPNIQTYLRDRRSQSTRSEMYGPNGVYQYDAHSPFVDIISTANPGDYFISNDLRKAAEMGRYVNGNKHWRKLYNATLIVPIKEPRTVSSENILGFLCIDSIDASFDEMLCLYVARIVANTVFYIVYSLSVLEKRRAAQIQEPTKKRIGDG